ncbi:hypothetical protein ACVLB3_002158 [Pseudarthrobacter sp. PvP022]
MCLRTIRLTGCLGRQRHIAYLLRGAVFATFACFEEISLKRGADYFSDGSDRGSAEAMTALEIRCAVALSGPGAGTKIASR